MSASEKNAPTMKSNGFALCFCARREYIMSFFFKTGVYHPPEMKHLKVAGTANSCLRVSSEQVLHGSTAE